MDIQLRVQMPRQILSIILLMALAVPTKVWGQSSPFPSNDYISPYDTICYEKEHLHYLIITTDSLRPAFKDFALSKAFKGYDVKIVAVEDIYHDYSNNTNITDSVERIKWFIGNQYVQCNKKLQYVLLGGDINIIPTRFAAPRVTVNLYEALDYALKYDSLKLLATDKYYTSFQNSFNWDDGGNGRYAEIAETINIAYVGNFTIENDNAHYKQAANISRLPVRNSSDIINYTKKLFRYERDELNSSYSYIRALFAGCYSFCNIGSVSDSRYWGDSICNNFLTGRMVTKLYDNNFTTSALHSALGNTYGYNLINIDTHGTETGWRMSDGVSYYNTDLVNALNANAASVITTTSCDVTDFTATESLGKSFILNPNNNSIAFWGSTNYGWGPLYDEFQSSPGASVELVGHFYRNLKNEPNKQLGHIVDKSCRDLDCYPDQYSPERFLQMSQTLLGDAEFTIYSGTPNHFTPFSLSLYDDNASLDPFYEDANYTLILDSDSNSTHNADYTTLSPITYLTVDNFTYGDVGPFQIGITQEGYAPWRSDKDYYDTVSIQDTDLDGEHLRAQTYILGKSVNNQYPSGVNQIVTGSDVTFEVGSSLTITDNFTCPVGATLTIKPLESIY